MGDDSSPAGDGATSLEDTDRPAANHDAVADGAAADHAATAGDTTVVIVAGPDEHGIGEELIDLGASCSRIEGIVSGERLEAAGIDDADVLVLTDVEEATGIPVAKELNPAVTVVTYADRSLPEFVAAAADIAVDPALLAPQVVAEELVDDA